MDSAPTERRDFFVSFNSADREIAEWIATELKAAGKSVYYQHWDFLPGNNFVLEMNRAARNSDRVIAVLSENYLKAEYTQPEWAAHFASDPTGVHRKVIPVRVRECEITGLLAPILYIDLVGCDDAQKRRRLLDGLNGTTGQHGRPSRDGELRYLERILRDVEDTARLYSPLEGITEVRPDPRLDPLLAAWKDTPYMDIVSHTPHKSRGIAEVRHYPDALDAIAAVGRAALLGEPGAGKSTTLRRRAAQLARRALADAHAPIPLLAALGKWAGDESLAELLIQQAPEIGRDVDALSREGRLALLLDGLNETPTASRGDKAAQVRARIGALDSRTEVLVSCRGKDYTEEVDLELDTLTLQELKPWQVREVLRHWLRNGGRPEQEADRLFWQLAGSEELAGVLETWIAAGATEESFWSVSDPEDNKAAYGKTSGAQDDLWRKYVPKPESLVRLAANPFLLTMLFQVWCVGKGELPRNRGELFGRFIDALLLREGLLEDRRTRRRTDAGDRLIAGLTALAWRMQRTRVDTEEKGDFGVLTVASPETALECIGDAVLLKKAIDGTLLEGENQIRFRHQLLQEHFTAQALRSRMTTVNAAEFWPPDRWWERSGWEVAAVLLAGLDPKDNSVVIRWLAGAQPEVAAQCILESGVEPANKPALLAKFQADWLPLLTDVKREARPEARAAIGRALGCLDLDNRKGVGVKDGIPDIDWVKVDKFYMSRYPVTNAQYEAFVLAEDGYKNDRWWEGLTNPDRKGEPPRWSEPNHPRETVNWYEAMAYCGWLSIRLGNEVRLPTEQEWERAAFGRDKRKYPWGNKYEPGCANIDETETKVGPHYLARTSPVGMYPHGASPEGVLDLEGNVWEWCLNEHAKPERTQRSGTEPRVLRGGSWVYYHDLVAFRYNYHPFNRYFNFGFRLVCSAPIPAGR